MLVLWEQKSERHCDWLRCFISTYSVEFYRKVVNSSVKPFSPGLFVVAKSCITDLVLLLVTGNLGVSCAHCSVLVNHVLPYICLQLDFSKILVYHYFIAIQNNPLYLYNTGYMFLFHL